MKSNSEAFNEGAQLMTVKQVAERLGCSHTNLYTLIEAGELPVIQVGARKGYRIDPRDLEAFIESRKFRFERPKASIPTTTLKHLKL